MSKLRRFLANESGATAIEYALILSLVFLAIVASVTSYSAKVSVMFNNIKNNLH